MHVQSERFNLIGVNMKNLSRLFRIYSEAPVSLAMAIGCILELVCALGLYAYNAHVLALCALVAASFFASAALTFSAYVYRDAKRSNLI
jgi:hypothetical protein